jgi:hypothetical protein
MAQAANQMSPGQANILARNMITSRALKRTQTIYKRTVDPSTENVLQIQPRNTGLILGFQINVRYNVDVAAATGTALTLTPYGPSNSLRQITFFDLNNNTRIQTTGRHMGVLNSARAQRPYNGVDSFDAYPVNYGNHDSNIATAAATIAQGADADVAFSYYIPLAYSEKDLRGAIYANVVSATMTLQLTLNSNPVVARTLAGWTDGVYATANDSTPPADVTVGNWEIEVVQVYYDQLPAGQKGVILPVLDLQTIYDIKNTAVTGMTANQDYPIGYSNFRDFLSTFFTYRNRVNADGTMNLGDLNSLALQSANYTDVFKVNEWLADSWNRNTFGLDLPLGSWMVDTRGRPISTLQFGNMEAVFNLSNVQAGASIDVGYEAFALTNTIGQAASLAGGAG